MCVCVPETAGRRRPGTPTTADATGSTIQARQPIGARPATAFAWRPPFPTWHSVAEAGDEMAPTRPPYVLTRGSWRRRDQVVRLALLPPGYNITVDPSCPSFAHALSLHFRAFTLLRPIRCRQSLFTPSPGPPLNDVTIATSDDPPATRNNNQNTLPTCVTPPPWC